LSEITTFSCNFQTEIEARFIHKNDAPTTELEAGCTHENEASITEIKVEFSQGIIGPTKYWL